jgi:hypothetical protein
VHALCDSGAAAGIDWSCSQPWSTWLVQPGCRDLPMSLNFFTTPNDDGMPMLGTCTLCYGSVASAALRLPQRRINHSPEVYPRLVLARQGTQAWRALGSEQEASARSLDGEIDAFGEGQACGSSGKTHAGWAGVCITATLATG